MHLLMTGGIWTTLLIKKDAGHVLAAANGSCRNINDKNMLSKVYVDRIVKISTPAAILQVLFTLCIEFYYTTSLHRKHKEVIFPSNHLKNKMSNLK